MSDRLASLRLFVRVARQGSFSAAGRDLGVPQPTVSRLIAALEKDIGVGLFLRSTRAVTLTEAGADFLARIEPVLDALEEAEHVARGTGELRGLLRVGLSSSFGIRAVAPRVPQFLARHPKLRIDLVVDDRRQDLITEGMDMAIRLGVLSDSTATAQLIGRVPRVVVASPGYLAQHGTPRHPDELAQHAMISGPGRLRGPWIFRKDGKQVTVRVSARLTVSMNEAATAAAVAGAGLASMTQTACQSELDAGKLQILLPDWAMGSVEVHAVFPAGRAAKPAARAFAAALAE